MKKVIFIGLIMLSFSHVSGQMLNDSMHIERGYLIYVRPNWVFLPSKDSSIDIFSTNYRESFIPGTFSLSFGVNLLPPEGFGQKKYMEYFDNLDGLLHQDTVYYFYCELKLFFATDTSMNRSITPCRYSLSHGNYSIGLCCRYLLNAIYNIEPYSEKDRMFYLAYLKRNNYPMPEWEHNCEAIE